jgi:DNA-binding CsgD family transcriptional regulator
MTGSSWYLQRIPEETVLTCECLSPRGKSTKEIAFVFDVSLKTVGSQRNSIIKRLDLFSIA